MQVGTRFEANLTRMATTLSQQKNDFEPQYCPQSFFSWPTKTGNVTRRSKSKPNRLTQLATNLRIDHTISILDGLGRRNATGATGATDVNE